MRPLAPFFRVACAAALLLATGCVGVPFASPPLQLSLGTGARGQTSPGEATVVDVPVQVRAGVHPLGFTPDLIARRVDFGVGYLLDTGRYGTLHGAYLEAGGMLLGGPVGERWGRLNLRMQGRLHFHGDGGPTGQGAAVQLTGELVGFASGPFDSTSEDGGAFGFAHGEGGVGFYLEGAWVRIDRTMGWSATTGLLFRLPASVGFAWAWAWSLL